MVPSGWERKALDEVSDVIDCKHRTPKYVENGIPLVSPGTIKWGAIDLESPTKRVTAEEYESLMDHCTVEYGDLVLSRNQSVGIASFVDSDKPFVLGQDTVLVKPKGSDPRFLFYNLQSTDTQKTIFKLAGGSTFSRINLGDIRKLKAIYPPFAEQQKIAKILSTWDKAISTTECLIDNSTQQKKALMQQLLTGKKRLLDESGKRFEGKWEEGKLADFAKIKKGKALSSKDLKEGSYPVIAGGKSSPYNHSDFTHENIITVSASGAYAGYIAFFPYKIWASDCSVVEPKSDNNIKYLYYWLTNQQQKIYTLQSGGAQPHIYPRDLDSMKISIPNFKEQQKIATVLTSADKEIELLEQQLADLQQEKKALMQVLLTGKKRVIV